MRTFLIAFFLAICGSGLFAAAPKPGSISQEALEETELVGSPAPEWSVTHWLNSPPQTLASLRGKVVLVRWWTAPGCPYCSASAPSLNELHRLYREKGLVVIGLYHHKSPRPLDPSEVEKYSRKFGFQFPIAIDPEWQTLKLWWLKGRERTWTSVSFLIDREGIIRYIHPGGAYAPRSKDYAHVKRKIEEIL